MLSNHGGTPNASRGSDGARSEWGELGLGAVVPHTANLRTTTGGGYGVQANGGGAAPGDNTGSAVAGTQGSSYRPIGRTTSPEAQGRKGGTRRNTFQPTAQGPRVSMAAFPTGGLLGLPDERDIGMGDFFGDVAKWGKRTFSPPGRGFSKISIGAPIAKLLPSPLRKAARYYGAGVQSIFFPVLSGSQQRQMWGLDANESGIFMKTQQVSRVAAAIIATYGVGTWLATPSSTAVAAPGTVLPPATTVTTVAPAQPFWMAPAAQTGWQAPTVAELAATPSSSLPVYSAPVAGSPSWLAVGGKYAAKSVFDAAILGTVGKLLSPGAQNPGGGNGVQVDAGQYGTPASGLGPNPAQPMGGMFGGGSGSGSSDAAPSEILASPSLPMIIAVTGMAVTLGVSLFKRKAR